MKKINNKIKSFWGISEVGFSFMSTVETTFFVIFLTDVAHVKTRVLPLPAPAIILKCLESSITASFCLSFKLE